MLMTLNTIGNLILAIASLSLRISSVIQLNPIWPTPNFSIVGKVRTIRV